MDTVNNTFYTFINDKCKQNTQKIEITFQLKMCVLAAVKKGVLPKYSKVLFTFSKMFLSFDVYFSYRYKIPKALPYQYFPLGMNKFWHLSKTSRRYMFQ